MSDFIDVVEEALRRLPNKDCGLCGSKTCSAFAELVRARPEELARCVFIAPPGIHQREETGGTPSTDILGREFDFVLEKLSTDLGPRETILPFNPSNLEKLGIKKGDYLVGRPAAAGCPISHCGLVVSEPDYFNGLVEWLVVGPMEARAKGINIGMYTPVAYEGLAIHARKELRFGVRYFFLPKYCMLQVRHSGLLNTLTRTREGLYVRMEGIMLA